MFVVYQIQKNLRKWGFVVSSCYTACSVVAARRGADILAIKTVEVNVWNRTLQTVHDLGVFIYIPCKIIPHVFISIGCDIWVFFHIMACGRVRFGIFDIPVVFLVKSVVSQLRFWYCELSKWELPHKPQCHGKDKKSSFLNWQVTNCISYLLFYTTNRMYKMVKLLLENIHFWNCETHQKSCWLVWTCNIKINLFHFTFNIFLK